MSSKDIKDDTSLVEELEKIEREYAAKEKKKFPWLWPLLGVAIIAVLVVKLVILPGANDSGNTTTGGSGGTVGPNGLINAGDSDTIGYVSDWKELAITDSADGAIRISFPDKVDASTITVENLYMDRSVNVTIPGITAKGYAFGTVEADTDVVKTAAYREVSGTVVVSVSVDGVWDYEVAVENNRIVLTPYKAAEKNDLVVMIMPVGGTSLIGPDYLMSEIGITTETAKITEFLGNENNIRYYVTNDIGSERAFTDVIAFYLDLQPDMVICIGLSKENDTAVYGMKAQYDDAYFDTRISNVNLAEALLRNVATTAKDKALSIDAAVDESSLKYFACPAAYISIGYVSNEQELALLLKEDYLKEIAKGIVNGTLEVKENF